MEPERTPHEVAKELLDDLHQAMTVQNTPTMTDGGWGNEYPDIDLTPYEERLDDHLRNNPELREDPEWEGHYRDIDGGMDGM